jgi:hypothetical protein
MVVMVLMAVTSCKVTDVCHSTGVAIVLELSVGVIVPSTLKL